MGQSEKQYRTLGEFFPFYLREHSMPACRAMHYIGSTLVLGVIGAAVYTSNYWLLPLMPVAGYGFAWAAHFFIEKNRPATFTYPFYSLASDWVMYFHFLTGTLRPQLEKAGVPVAPRAA
jgi:hypothetical protein